MEIKLMISADDSAMKFAELLGGLFQEGVVIEGSGVEPTLEKTIAVGTEPMGEFTTQDVKMKTAPVDVPSLEEAVDCNSTYLRKKIKEEAIRVVKSKKRDELKALNAEFGISKVDELSSDHLQDYLDKVSSL